MKFVFVAVTSKMLAASVFFVALSTQTLMAAPPCDSYPTPHSPESLGDTWYEPRVTNADISRYVRDFSMDQGDWDDGMGWDNPEMAHLPFAKTLNAIYALDKSRPPGEPTTSWLGRGYDYARNSIDELDATCDNSDYFAISSVGSAWDNYTELAQPFFFVQNVAERAGTIVHEARHADGGYSHTGCCVYGAGGCDQSWSSKGAFYVEVNWLVGFSRRGINALATQKMAALDYANALSAEAFCTPGPRF